MAWGANVNIGLSPCGSFTPTDKRDDFVINPMELNSECAIYLHVKELQTKTEVLQATLQALKASLENDYKLNNETKSIDLEEKYSKAIQRLIAKIQLRQ